MRKLAILFFLAITVVSCQRELTIELAPPALPAQSLLNVSYGSDPMQSMDIYLPAGRSDTTKILIMVHGGTWISGDKSEMTPFVKILQQRLPGYAIVNINYRLATTVTNHFPTQENDMKAVVDFLVVKGGEYRISQKFVLLGASAGAHMSLLQAYKYNSPSIKAVVDFFGPSDMVDLFNNTTDPSSLMAFQLLMGGTPAGNPLMFQQSSPLNFVSSQSPPTIILHGEIDNLVPVSQSLLLKNKLQSSGIEHRLIIYPNLGHDIWPDATMTDAFNQIEAFIKANVQ
jgi:acetyl esterase/lipase